MGSRIKIGIIGGSGLDDPKLLKDFKEISSETKFGKPSSTLAIGTIKDADVVILARHGKKHTVYPTGVNYRANIAALKQLGCTHIVATTACGSLREEIKPGHIVFPDQFIDFTRRRALTFHDEKVIHTPMSEPFCKQLRGLLGETAKELSLGHHLGGVVIAIEGPRFSTKAESHMFRSWKADIINMTTVPEVVLAREAGMCYQSIAMSTDYDCWREGDEPVTWDMIVERMEQNADNVRKLLIAVIPKIKFKICSCMENATAIL